MFRTFKHLLSRVLAVLRGHPPAAPGDPFAWRAAPVKPRPRKPSSAVAVAEPDDDDIELKPVIK